MKKEFLFLLMVLVLLISVGSVSAAEICTDDIDNDGDGSIDCNDLDCFGSYVCWTAQSLIGHWTFEDDINYIIVEDKSINPGGDGVLTDGARFQVESIPYQDPYLMNIEYLNPPNHVVVLDGINDFVGVGNYPQYDFGSSDYTISAWIKPTGPHNGDLGAIISKYSFANNSRQWWLGHRNGDVSQPNTLQAYTNPDGTHPNGHNYVTSTDYVNSTNIINQNEWTHVVSKKEGGLIYLYINGRFINTDPATNIVTGKDAWVHIGKIASNNFYFNGMIDDVRMYNISISERAICELARSAWINDECYDRIETLFCSDGLDNDNDGDVDCDDVDCDDLCNPETMCEDGIDNDEDGDTDCQDSDCSSSCVALELSSPLIINENTDLEHNIIAEGIDAIHVTTDGVTLDCAGHTITGDGSGNGIVIDGVNDVTVRDCIFDNFQNGTYVYQSNDNKFYENTFRNMGWSGMYLDGSNENKIIGNTINYNGKDGIWIYNHWNDLGKNIINDNIIHDNGWVGIRLYAKDNDIFNNNITVAQNGIYVLNRDNNEIIENQISDITNYGIDIRNSPSTKIIENVIDMTGKNNIYIIRQSHNSIIENNTLTNSQNGARSGYAVGIFNKDTNNLKMNNNYFSEHQLGIYTKNASGNSYDNNIVVSSNYGFRILDESDNIQVTNNRLCNLAITDFKCDTASSGVTGSNNFGDSIILCADGSPQGAFYTCIEQDACGDGLDNDGDGNVDCMDEDCNYLRCGESSICYNNLCTDVQNTDIPAATTVPEEILNPVIFDTYYHLFTFLNTGIVVSVPSSSAGICNEVCTTNGKVCGFAQGGINTCREAGSEYCTCY